MPIIPAFATRLPCRILAIGLVSLLGNAAWAAPLVEMWKDSSCGCCMAWAQHLEEAGFEVAMHDTRAMREVKIEHDVPREMASCHTALIGGYVIEGHVPAADIQRLLDEAPDVTGLAVPGMPHGSPGMETGRVDDYAVFAFGGQHQTPQVFQAYIND